MSPEANLKNSVVEGTPAGQGGAQLSIQDLHVWFELRRFGFGHAGFVRAVDGVTFNLEAGEAVREEQQNTGK